MSTLAGGLEVGVLSGDEIFGTGSVTFGGSNGGDRAPLTFITFCTDCVRSIQKLGAMMPCEGAELGSGGV